MAARAPLTPALASGRRIAGAFIAVIDGKGRHAPRHAGAVPQGACAHRRIHPAVPGAAGRTLRYPDLILCDYLQLGGSHERPGRCTADKGAHRPRGAGVIITGDVGAADLRRVADAGLPLLRKPVGTDRLLAAINVNDPPTGEARQGKTVQTATMRIHTCWSMIMR